MEASTTPRCSATIAVLSIAITTSPICFTTSTTSSPILKRRFSFPAIIFQLVQQQNFESWKSSPAFPSFYNLQFCPRSQGWSFVFMFRSSFTSSWRKLKWNHWKFYDQKGLSETKGNKTRHWPRSSENLWRFEGWNVKKSEEIVEALVVFVSKL